MCVGVWYKVSYNVVLRCGVAQLRAASCLVVEGVPMSAITVRLPDALSEYLNSRIERGSETKTQVVIAALECLRDRELEALMREGYAERSAHVLEESETALPASTEAWPEW